MRFSYFQAIAREMARCLKPVDVLSVGFLTFLTLMNLAVYPHVRNSGYSILLNSLWSILLCGLCFRRNRSTSGILSFIHDWSVLPLIFFVFKELDPLVRLIHHSQDFDSLLISLDRLIFCADPTRWLMRYQTPLITEVLQICYAMFFTNFILIGGSLYRRRNRLPFDHFAVLCAYGFFLSYLGYFVFPAIGPRFALHDFARLERDLPGMWLTPYLRWIINWGDSIPAGSSPAIAASLAQRDVFPSGHTMMTLVAVYSSYKYRIPLRHFLAGSGALLILGAVYLRYHYVVDLAAGVLLAWICLATWRGVYSRLEQNQGARSK